MAGPSPAASGRACNPMWTSREELELLFGPRNIVVWADVENTNNPRFVALKIDWAVRTATSDAKSRLRGSIADGIVTPGEMLRAMTTALAGVWLYTARGVKDTSSEEGRFRLSWARKKADDWFDDVVANKIELEETDSPVAFPFAIAPRNSAINPFGPNITPEQQLYIDQRSELTGVQNSSMDAYNLWWDGFAEIEVGDWL